MPDKLCFACIQNAGRSQMSMGWLNALVDPESATAISAGSRPATHVHPEVVDALKEVGIDVSANVPTLLSKELLVDNGVNIVVTMGCGDACPYVPGVDTIAWQVPDPHGAKLDAVREIRDYLKQQVLDLAKEKGYKLKAA